MEDDLPTPFKIGDLVTFGTAKDNVSRWLITHALYQFADLRSAPRVNHLRRCLAHGDLGLVMASMHHSEAWVPEPDFEGGFESHEKKPSAYLVYFFQEKEKVLVYGNELQEKK